MVSVTIGENSKGLPVVRWPWSDYLSKGATFRESINALTLWYSLPEKASTKPFILASWLTLSDGVNRYRACVILARMFSGIVLETKKPQWG